MAKGPTGKAQHSLKFILDVPDNSLLWDSNLFINLRKLVSEREPS